MSKLLAFLQQEEEAFRSQPRLASLYSDFSLRRSTNPDGYAANSTAWLQALNKAARHGLLSDKGLLTLTYDERLLDALRSSKWGQPLALDAVMRDALGARTLIPLDDFLAGKQSLYASSWPGPWDVVRWGLRRLGVTSPGSALGSLVSVSNVEAAAKHVAEHLSRRRDSYTSRIMSRKLFETEISGLLSSLSDFAATPPTPTDAAILLVYLSRDRPVLSYKDDVIKLFPSSGRPESMTDQDATMANLRDLITSLDTQCQTLTEKTNSLNTQIRSALSANKTQEAKSILRTRRLVDSTLQTRSQTLHRLESVFASIETAATQLEIVAVMQASANVLRDINRQTGGVEGAERVVAQLDDAMDDVAAVGEVLEPTVKDSVVDEDELELELERLERLTLETTDAEAGAQRNTDEKDIETLRLQEQLRNLALPSLEPGASSEPDRLIETTIEAR